jgi:hypothetical protein
MDVDKLRNVGLCGERLEQELSVTNQRGRSVTADGYKSRARADACKSKSRSKTVTHALGRGRIRAGRKKNYAQNLTQGNREGRIDRMSSCRYQSVSESNQRGRSGADSGRDCHGREGVRKVYRVRSLKDWVTRGVQRASVSFANANSSCSSSAVNLQIPMSRRVYQIASRPVRNRRRRIGRED